MFYRTAKATRNVQITNARNLKKREEGTGMQLLYFNSISIIQLFTIFRVMEYQKKKCYFCKTGIDKTDLLSNCNFFMVLSPKIFASVRVAYTLVSESILYPSLLH